MLPQTHLPAINKTSIKKKQVYQLCQSLQTKAKLVDYSFCNAWQPSFALSINKPQIIIVFSATNSIILNTRQGPVSNYLLVKNSPYPPQCPGGPGWSASRL
jgi:hypothetical protein